MKSSMFMYLKTWLMKAGMFMYMKLKNASINLVDD